MVHFVLSIVPPFLQTRTLLFAAAVMDLGSTSVAHFRSYQTAYQRTEMDTSGFRLPGWPILSEETTMMMIVYELGSCRRTHIHQRYKYSR